MLEKQQSSVKEPNSSVTMYSHPSSHTCSTFQLEIIKANTDVQRWKKLCNLST